MKLQPITPYTAIGSRQAMAQNLFRCGRCQKPSSQAGSRKRFVLGLQVKVCAACVAKEPKP